MRKALLAAAAACSMIVPSTSQAATTENFTLLAPIPPSNAVAPQAACATGPDAFTDKDSCQKAPFVRLARCLWLTDPGNAQSGREGKVAYVFKINALKIRGADKEDERDNKWFDLKVQNKLVTNTPGQMDLPDVDVTFYANLGVCASDIDVGVQDLYIPVTGEGATDLKSGFLSRSRYWGPGDELDQVFPGGAYNKLSDPTGDPLYASAYFAIVTVYGGTQPGGVQVSLTCKGHGAFQGHPTGNPGACADGWFQQL